MSTQLQIVNKVLTRLRESTVASVDDTSYSKLIAELLNQAKMHVEDEWDWFHLRQTITVTTASGTFKYTLTGAGDRCRILRDYSVNPTGWDVVNDTEDYNLTKAPSSGWMTRQLLNNSVQTGNPFWFDMNGQSGGDPQVDLFPIPGAIQTIKFNLVIPQDDFATDGTDDSTELTVPDWPVILKTYALALEERGEDGGTSQKKADDAADDALWTAIMREMSINSEETDSTIA